MSTYTAAYCSECGTYVLVSIQGDCSYGHPRSSLRGMYKAEIDKKTGYPKPPSAEQRAASMRVATAPVAPIVLPVDVAPGPAINLDEQFDADWPVKAQPVEGLYHPPRAPATVPLDPVMKAMGSRMPKALVLSDAHGIIGRLFGPPRGRHSAGVPAIGPVRGKHSAK